MPPVDEAMIKATIVESRIDGHEKVCAERYGEIKDSFSRVHNRMDDQSKEMKRIFWGVLVVLATVLWWVITNGRLPWMPGGQ